MRKVAFLFILVFTGFRAAAQKPVPFKIKFLPGKTYRSVIASNAELEIDSATAQKQPVSANLLGGSTFPIKINSQRLTVATINTGHMSGDSSFIITMRFDSIYEKRVINGTIATPPSDPLAGHIVYGRYTKADEIKVDSIQNMPASDNRRATVLAMIETISKAIRFPETSLNVGDSFTKKVPIEMPFLGINAKVDVEATYKLIEIKEGKAFLSVNEKFGISFSGEQNKMNVTATGSGSGTGTASYVINRNFADSSDISKELTFVTHINGLDMFCKVKERNTCKTEVVAAK